MTALGVDDRIAGDAEEPGEERLAARAKRRKGSVGAQKRFLGQIFGIGRIASTSQEIPVNRPEIAEIERRESVGSLLRGADEHSVVVWWRLVEGQFGHDDRSSPDRPFEPFHTDNGRAERDGTGADRSERRGRIERSDVFSPPLRSRSENEEEKAVRYFLKTERGRPARELDEATGQQILHRGRHEGRRVVELFVLHPDGRIDRYQERARRKLGSNAIVSRTWLAETYHPERPGQWSDDRYVPSPEEALAETEPAPEAVVLVLLGAEEDDEPVLAQLQSLSAQRS